MNMGAGTSPTLHAISGSVSLTVQFFLPVLGNLSSHANLLPGLGKKNNKKHVDARSFYRL